MPLESSSTEVNTFQHGVLLPYKFITWAYFKQIAQATDNIARVQIADGVWDLVYQKSVN